MTGSRILVKKRTLKYIYHGPDKEPHPFYVKSTWIRQIQPSVALESYLEEVKVQPAEVNFTKPKDNLPPEEREAIKALKRNTKINLLKKTDKGTTTMVLNKHDKINEGQTELNNKDHYRELEQLMVIKTDCKVRQLVNED